MEAALGSLILTVAVVAFLAITNWDAKRAFPLDDADDLVTDRPARQT